MSKPELPFRDLSKIPGDEGWEIHVGSDPSPSVDEHQPTAHHKVWYVRWGQAISDFFTSLPDRFSRLWQSVRNAGDAVVRFCSGRGDESDAKIATMHIRTSGSEVTAAPFPSGQVAKSPTIYFPIDETNLPDDRPTETEIPDAMSSSASGDPAATGDQAPAASIAKATLDAYRARKSQGQDASGFLDDEQVLKFAEKIVRNAARIEYRGLRLDPEHEELRHAAREFLSERSAYLDLARQNTASEARQRERLQAAEALAAKQPGQHDFESFVAAYVLHRDENRSFTVHEGSKYLGEECIAYGKSLAGRASADERAALDFLESWHRSPDTARRLVQQTEGFVHPAIPNQQEQVFAVADNDTAPPEAGTPTHDQAPSAPPPPPSPRWISMLQRMTHWSPQQLSAIAEQVAMSYQELGKAMQGLRSLAEIASERDLGATPERHRPETVEQKMNYRPEARRRDAELLDSLELASLLLSRLGGGSPVHFEEAVQSFFARMKSVIPDLEKELARQIKELRPETGVKVESVGVRIPSLQELTSEQASVGSTLFGRYVDGYTRLSTSTTYTLPDKSPYFKPECLAYAQAFYDQVANLPGGAEVSSEHMMAAVYLLSEARKRKLIAGTG